VVLKNHLRNVSCDGKMYTKTELSDK